MTSHDSGPLCRCVAARSVAALSVAARNGGVAGCLSSLHGSPLVIEHRAIDRIFVGGLPRSATEETLRAAFALNGSVVGAIDVVHNGATGLPRGFAFVKLLVRFDASIDPRALDLLASTTVDGRTVEIQGVPERWRSRAAA